MAPGAQGAGGSIWKGIQPWIQSPMGPLLTGVGPGARKGGLLGTHTGLSTPHTCWMRSPTPGPRELVPGPGELLGAASHTRVYGNSRPVLCGLRVLGGKDEALSSAGTLACRAPAPRRRGCGFTGLTYWRPGSHVGRA